MMDKKTAKAIWRTALSILTRPQLRRLAGHLAKKTPIICGADAIYYLKPGGCGCPATLAIVTKVPKVAVPVKEMRYSDSTTYQRISLLYMQMVDKAGDFYGWRQLLDALQMLNQNDMRTVIRQVLKSRGIPCHTPPHPKKITASPRSKSS